jgi:hypothetical protein
MVLKHPTLNTLLLLTVGFGSWLTNVRSQSVSDPASFVLPFIGSTNGGHVFPGEVSLGSLLYTRLNAP